MKCAQHKRTLKNMSRRTALIVLLLIVLFGVGLRAWQLTSRSLWFDEAFSWRLSQFPLAEMIMRTAQDVHPPLYYAVLKGWTVIFGSSLLGLRSFSVVLAGATIAAGYLLVSYALASRGAGLVAALLLAVSGFEIQFAWEARMYTLGTLLALLSTWCLLHALQQRTQRIWWWLAYGVTAAAFAYTHYYALFSLIAHALLVVVYILVGTRGRVGEIVQWRLFWYALIAAGLTVALFAPWLPTFMQQQQQVQESFWIPALDRWSVPDTFVRMYAPTTRPLPRQGLGLAITLGPLVATILMWLALFFIARGRSTTGRWGLRAFLICGAVPFAVSVLFSLLNAQSVYQDRFFIFAHLFVVVGWAAVLWHIPWRTLRGSAVLGATILLVAASLAYWFEIDIPHKPGAHAAAREIFMQRRAEEPVVVSSPFVFFAIDHYAEEEFSQPQVVKLFSESGQLAHFAGGPILTPANIVGADIFAAHTPALWIVDTTGFGGSPLVVPHEWRKISQRSFPEVYGYQGDVTVTRYERDARR